MNKLSILTKGIIKENPVLVLLLGCCPTLAVTTSCFNGLGMGVSTLAVLVCANIVISLLRNIIPDKVRIPCFIVVIAAFVTIVQFALKAYMPELDKALGLFIPLIVVNCIILGRAEMFASKNGVIDSALDGIGMGIGFTLALGLMGLIREFLGSGYILAGIVGVNGINVYADIATPAGIFMLAPGGFFIFGIMIAAVNFFTKGKGTKKEFSCEGCLFAGSCNPEDKCKGKEADA